MSPNGDFQNNRDFGNAIKLRILRYDDYLRLLRSTHLATSVLISERVKQERYLKMPHC